MIHIAGVSWLDISNLVKVVQWGQWETTLGLAFLGVLVYFGLKERYLILWLGGWVCYLLSHQAATPGDVSQRVIVGCAFVLAVTLFSAAAQSYTDSRRYLFWTSVLGAVTFCWALATAAWFPASFAALFCIQVLCHVLAAVAAVRLLLFARGRRTAGTWIFALALLILMPPGTRFADSHLAGVLEFATAVLLRLSILLMVLDQSRARAQRLEVMNAISSVTCRGQDYSTMMMTAMSELCHLYGAKLAWFQLVEGEDVVVKLQVGLPEWFVEKRRWVPVRDSLITMLSATPSTIRVSVRSFPAGLRADAERIGFKYVLLVPVIGETATLGILAFGLSGRRSFTGEQLRFLTTTANQLGVAGENLRMFEQVSHAQRQWLSTFDSIDDSILVHDAGEHVLWMNRALSERLGRSQAEVAGAPIASVLSGADDGCPYCRMAKQSSGEVPDPCLGGYSMVSTSSYVENQGGRAGTVHIIADRTERRAGEERYRLLFESVQEGVFASTPDGRVVDCNPALVSMLGYDSAEELLSVNIGSAFFLNPEQRAAYTAAMEEHGYLRNYEIALRRKDGRVVTLLENSFGTRDQQGRITRYQGFLVDITEKKRAEEEMRRRNRELGALNAMATIATRTFNLDEILQNTLRWTTELYAEHCDILLFDPESRRVTRSETSRPELDGEREALRLLAEEEFVEYFLQSRSEIITEQDIPRLPKKTQAWIAQHGYESFAVVVMYSHNKLMGMLLVSSPNKHQFTETDRNLAIAIARQLGNSVEKVVLYEETARAYENLRNAQEQLLQSEKMSAVGQLISGVAHELNNPLTAILGYAQLLETEPIGDRARDFVNKLYRQTQRTHRVVQNLLSFSRQRKPIQSQVDLRRVLEDTITLREPDLKLNNVTVERSYDPATPFITGDAHQLEQVFLNIINNAVDAMMDLGQSGVLKVQIYAEDGRACIEFRDSGPGLRAPNKIFDPFYTTKKIGKGTGLGLSICYGIVKEHRGDILAFNHEEGGAVFQIKLPVAGNHKPSLVAEGKPTIEEQ